MCPQEIPSKRDYHPGHQQSDLSQGGEEVEVKPTSTTPVCGCEFERETHAVAHSHTTASLHMYTKTKRTWGVGSTATT